MTTPSRSVSPALRGLAVLVGAAALAYLWWGWCVFPLSDWNEIRLAPAFALRHGLTVYAPAGGGPLSTWIYGPLPILLNLPATFAPDATAAILTSGVINLLTLFGPLAVLCGCAEALRPLAAPGRIFALAACVLLLPGSSLAFQVADHAAVGCGLISTWLLVRGSSPAQRSVAGAALCCALAVAAKQTSVFLALAHVIHLASGPDRALLGRYLIALTAAGLALAGVCVAAFGFTPLWFNLVEIPARLPWGDGLMKLGLRWPQLAAYLVPPVGLLILWRRFAPWSGTETEIGRLVRCGAIAFCTVLPVGLLAFFKIGGDLNVLHSWSYLMPVLVIGGVAWLGARPRASRWLTLVAGGLIALRAPHWRETPAQPLTPHLAQAAGLARFAPGTVWFPNNPVVTFYTDRRLYHVEDGLATRHLAGVGIREAEFRRHLPSPLAAVVYPASYPSPFALQLLSDYTQVTRVNHWAMYQRPEAPRP